ncbi:hypothetical protein X798_01242 [Onchocerca flexuosa]|uniref:Uncharacterized protein n=1 Tax=Onchocerca flexuosa TaxID=387005 RepID=A0A238C2L5_9BILA|nr:hypothetical protein X798_01242 [Onchocerca flexuosa]
MDCKLILSFYILLANLVANAIYVNAYYPGIYAVGTNVQTYDMEPLDVQPPPYYFYSQNWKSQDPQPHTSGRDAVLQEVQGKQPQACDDQLCDDCKVIVNCGNKIYKPQKWPTTTTRKPVTTSTTKPRPQWDCPCPCQAPQRCRMCSPCQESYIQLELK